MQANGRRVLHRRETLFYVLLRYDSYAPRAEKYIPSDVIKVAMCIHQPRDGAHRRFEYRVAQFGSPRIHSAIDQESAAVINNRRNVSSIPGKHE